MMPYYMRLFMCPARTCQICEKRDARISAVPRTPTRIFPTNTPQYNRVLTAQAKRQVVMPRQIHYGITASAGLRMHTHILRPSLRSFDTRRI